MTRKANPRRQTSQKHPEEWRRDLSPDWMAGQNIGGAAEAHERMTRTAELAEQVGDVLGLSAPERARVRQAAQLHDIGKVAVPDSLLTQAPPLDPSDWEFLQQCPTIGERITAAAPALATLAPLVRSTRERFDGTGYPDRLAGDHIPLGARIIGACSALVAMTSARPYAPARTIASALAEMHLEAGRQFDPRIVAALTEVLVNLAADRPVEVSRSE